jgi:hypothetical protein
VADTKRRRRRIDPVLAKLTEREYQRRIEQRAKKLGYLCNHVNKATVAGGRFITPTSHAGFPDLWLLCPGTLIVFEVKREAAPPSEVKEAQKEWIRLLQSVAGVEAYVVRPSDWPHVETLLLEGAANARPNSA